MQSIVTFIKRMTSLCLQSLHHRFVDWTQPSITSLPLGTVTDLARTKFELVAENALLRQQLILLSCWLIGKVRAIWSDVLKGLNRRTDATSSQHSGKPAPTAFVLV